MFAFPKTLTVKATDDHMIAAMRLVLASLALLIVSIDPSEPVHYVTATSAVLAGYIAYSALLYGLALRGSRSPLVAYAHWVDVGWYVVLIGLSSGTNSMFFIFFFFAILTAAFGWGFLAGLRVTVVATLLFTVVGFVTAPAAPEFDLNHFLLRPTCLLGLGYMIAHWGGSENVLKQRLALLKDVSTLSNPRFGIDRTLGSILERLRTFYDAEVCVLLMADPMTGIPQVHGADRHSLEAGGRPECVPPAMTHLLIRLPAQQALLSHRSSLGGGWPWRMDTEVQAYDVKRGERLAGGVKVSDVLMAPSFITVPVCYRGETVGRLYLAASRPSAFDPADVAFLLQVLEHTMPSLDNIRLVDRLASDAAETERQRIARDLHDSIIQPYIGLQMGLAAIRQKLMAGRMDVQADVERMLELTTLGIADLRRYVHGLKDDGGEPEGGLLPAVRRYTRTFAEATGLTVQVDAAADMRLNDRLAAEVFQMVVEGLSNVRRHTTSAWATVRLACHAGHLMLRIENAASGEAPPGSFAPRSLTERATALGGHVEVAQTSEGTTTVTVEIPL